MTTKEHRQLQDHVGHIIEEAQHELVAGHYEDATSIMRRAIAETMRATGRLRVAASRTAPLRDPSFSSSLATGLNLLAAFNENGRSLLGIKDLAEELGVPRSTTHRYVRSLVELGQLEQDPATRKYRRVAAA